MYLQVFKRSEPRQKAALSDLALVKSFLKPSALHYKPVPVSSPLFFAIRASTLLNLPVIPSPRTRTLLRPFVRGQL